MVPRVNGWPLPSMFKVYVHKRDGSEPTEYNARDMTVLPETTFVEFGVDREIQLDVDVPSLPDHRVGYVTIAFEYTENKDESIFFEYKFNNECGEHFMQDINLWDAVTTKADSFDVEYRNKDCEQEVLLFRFNPVDKQQKLRQQVLCIKAFDRNSLLNTLRVVINEVRV